MDTRQIGGVFRASIVAIAVAGIVGCGGQDAASYMASAKTYAAKSDYKAAIIEIKNALQQDPSSAEARHFLAKALLETGDAVGAEAEVRKAIDLKLPDDLAYPLLARTIIAQGDSKRLLREVSTRKLETPAARADLGVSIAGAYVMQGDLKSAKAWIDAALVDQPENVRALLLQAQFAGQGGDMDSTQKFIDRALAAAPNNIDATLMKVEIELRAGRRDEAGKLLDQLVAAHPRSLQARYASLTFAVTGGKLDFAKEQLAKMKEIQPREFRTVYADAMVSFAAGDNTHARDVVQAILASKPDHLPSHLLSGLSNLQLGAYAVAEDSLLKVLARAPDNPGATRALAAIYLRTGRAPQALETLGPALRRHPNDPVLLRTAGEAYLSSGNPALATTSYERANAIDKDNVGSKVRLAQVRLAAGETQRAFDDLESLSAADSSKYQADLALFARARQGASGGRRAGEEAAEHRAGAESPRNCLSGKAGFRECADQFREGAPIAAGVSLGCRQSRADRHAGRPTAGRACALRATAGKESQE